MSYPDPVYVGESGEASATFRPISAGPDIVYPSGNAAAHYLAKGTLTGGKFGLYRWDMPGPPSGPGPHFHRTISESFYVLAGTIRIYDGRRWIDTVPGDFIYVPEGGVHAFRNESGEAASMLILFAPGAPREGYFEGLAEFQRAGQPGPDALADFYADHDNIWVHGAE